MTPEEKKQKEREYYAAYQREYRKKHPERVRANNLRYREKNREQMREKNRAYRKARPDITRKTWLKQKYGITLEQYDALLEAQGGVCAICKKPQNERVFAVDHDHITGKVRGLLHRKCNAALGYLDESPAAMRSAADYIERHRQ